MWSISYYISSFESLSNVPKRSSWLRGTSSSKWDSPFLLVLHPFLLLLRPRLLLHFHVKPHGLRSPALFSISSFSLSMPLFSICLSSKAWDPLCNVCSKMMTLRAVIRSDTFIFSRWRRTFLCCLLYQMTGRLSRAFLMVISSKATLKITHKIPIAFSGEVRKVMLWKKQLGFSWQKRLILPILLALFLLALIPSYNF